MLFSQNDFLVEPIWKHFFAEPPLSQTFLEKMPRWNDAIFYELYYDQTHFYELTTYMGAIHGYCFYWLFVRVVAIVILLFAFSKHKWD